VEQGITLIVVSHDPQVRAEADIVHEMRDGMLVETRVKNTVRVPGLDKYRVDV
jgi:ABC-type glutathione transport system ATPase component